MIVKKWSRATSATLKRIDACIAETQTRQYKERFLKPVAEQMTQLLSINSAQVSPILEMIQMVNLNSIQRHNVDGPKQLIVLSDLLQNSKLLSMYKSVPTFEAFNATSYAQKVKSNFEGIEIKVHLLQNAPNLQKQNLFEFWKKYFESSGATTYELQLLPGWSTYINFSDH